MTLSEVMYCYVTSFDILWCYVVSFGIMGVMLCYAVLCADMWRCVAIHSVTWHYVALCSVM